MSLQERQFYMPVFISADKRADITSQPHTLLVSRSQTLTRKVRVRVWLRETAHFASDFIHIGSFVCRYEYWHIKLSLLQRHHKLTPEISTGGRELLC